MLEHPEIAWIERTGYPSWLQESEENNGEELTGQTGKKILEVNV